MFAQFVAFPNFVKSKDFNERHEPAVKARLLTECVNSCLSLSLSLLTYYLIFAVSSSIGAVEVKRVLQPEVQTVLSVAEGSGRKKWYCPSDRAKKDTSQCRAVIPFRSCLLHHGRMKLFVLVSKIASNIQLSCATPNRSNTRDPKETTSQAARRQQIHRLSLTQ